MVITHKSKDRALLQEAATGTQKPAERDLALKAALHALQSLPPETSPDEAAALIQGITGDNRPATAFAITVIGAILVAAQKGDVRLPGPLEAGPRKRHRYR